MRSTRDSHSQGDSGRKKDLLGPLKKQPRSVQQRTALDFSPSQVSLKSRLLKAVCAPASITMPARSPEKPHVLQITALEGSPRVPGEPRLAPQAAARRAGSAVGVEHTAGADAAEEAAAAEGARVTAGGRRRLAAASDGHAGVGRWGPGPLHLPRRLSLWGNTRAARVAHVRLTCAHLFMGTLPYGGLQPDIPTRCHCLRLLDSYLPGLGGLPCLPIKIDKAHFSP